MDIGLPQMDGIAATRAIRGGNGASRDAPIVAVTAHALPADLERFAAAGITDTLIKPLSRDGVRALLAGLPVPAASDPEGPVDPAQVAALVEGLGRAAFDDLLGRYIDETDDGLARLAAAAAPQGAADPEMVADLAHRLAGGAAVFGATRLHATLTALETAARADPPGPVPPLAADLAPIWQETRAAFAQGTPIPAGHRP